MRETRIIDLEFVRSRDMPVHAAHQQDAGVETRQLLGHVAAGAEVEPRADAERQGVGRTIDRIGANLGEVMMAQMMGADLAPFIESFQRAVLALRYATKPVVVTTHQQVLGGEFVDRLAHLPLGTGRARELGRRR